MRFGDSAVSSLLTHSSHNVVQQDLHNISRDGNLLDLDSFWTTSVFIYIYIVYIVCSLPLSLPLSLSTPAKASQSITWFGGRPTYFVGIGLDLLQPITIDLQHRWVRHRARLRRRGPNSRSAALLDPGGECVQARDGQPAVATGDE